MIDVKYNFYDDVKDIPKDKKHDPDTRSPTLRKYHHLIWGDKELPHGKFDLDELLVCKSANLKFGVDCFYNLYLDHKKPMIKNIIDEAYVGKESERFKEPAYTIGASLIFPKMGVDSINSRRGCYSTIRDRIDLTLECIRRYYAHERPNPLERHLKANKKFFDLFGDFEGYIKFFLLDDFVSDDFKEVNFLLPFDNNLKTDGYPKNLPEWLLFRDRLGNLIENRNTRIEKYCKSKKL